MVGISFPKKFIFWPPASSIFFGFISYKSYCQFWIIKDTKKWQIWFLFEGVCFPGNCRVLVCCQKSSRMSDRLLPRNRQKIIRAGPNDDNRSETTPENDDYNSVKFAGIFGNLFANWLFVSEFAFVLTSCHYIFIDEMRDWFTVTPTILTIAAAFCR